MLNPNQPALQVKRDGKWLYVFCRVMPHGAIATTNTRAKALSAKRDLEWFRNEYGNDEFRADR
jgi:hypothetical protein